MILALVLAALAAGEDVDAAIVALLPQAPLSNSAPVPVGATAATHAEALRAHPQHGENFWVGAVVEGDHAGRVVFLIPQYHRNITMPIAWTSLGGEISDVQENIDLLVRLLATRHGLTCIGTEGTSRSNVSYSSELRQLAWWRRELDRGHGATLSQLGGDAERARSAIDTTRELLLQAIGRHAVYLDGVGAAQSRLAGEARVVRFGIEQEAVLGDAIVLLEELKRVEEELAKVDPGSAPTEAGVVGQMWLDEYPEHQKTTLAPLANALMKLEGLRRELRRDGFEDAAKGLAVWMARVRRITDALIQPDEVSATIAHYREVERIVAAGGAGPARELSAAQKKRRAALLARQAKVYSRYEAVTRKHRERVAATKIIERMSSSRHRRCAVVMGAGHEDALAEELRAAAKRAGIGSLGIVVVAPFNFE